MKGRLILRYHSHGRALMATSTRGNAFSILEDEDGDNDIDEDIQYEQKHLDPEAQEFKIQTNPSLNWNHSVGYEMRTEHFIIQRKKEYCEYYNDGVCKFSDKFCNDIHDPSQIIPLERKKPCFNFHWRNSCRFGEHCRYRHDYKWQKKENDEKNEKTILQLQKENDKHLKKNEELKQKHDERIDALKRQNDKNVSELIERTKQLTQQLEELKHKVNQMEKEKQQREKESKESAERHIQIYGQKQQDICVLHEFLKKYDLYHTFRENNR